MAVLSLIAILEKTLPAAAALEKVIGLALCGLAASLLLSRGQEGLYLFKVLASHCQSHN
ncbi:MAG: hypothetical protein JSR89_18375 [Proteobacteria bacterium]|nr:hypothetical protein [Pseudomonadota bacterium]